MSLCGHRVSLCMIVRDEERHLGPCLESTLPLVDEMVIVDTGSTDRTREIAEGFGARVSTWPWRDDFAAARNESLQGATGEWIVVLDADERVDAAAFDALREAVETPDIVGIELLLRSEMPPGHPVPSYAAPYCRLFRNLFGLRYRGRVHEQIAPALRARGRIVRSDVEITHLGYAEPDGAKLERNLRLLEQELDDRPEDAFVLFNLGLTLAAQGRSVRAELALKRAVSSTEGPLDSMLRAFAWMKLAELRLARRQWAEALAASCNAQAEGGDLSLARFAEGRARFELGDVQGAAALFRDLLDGPADGLGMTVHPHLVCQALGIASLRLGDFEGAVQTLSRAAREGGTGETFFLLGNAFLGLKRLDNAARWYLRARDAGYDDPNLGRRLELCTSVIREQLAGTRPLSAPYGRTLLQRGAGPRLEGGD